MKWRTTKPIFFLIIAFTFVSCASLDTFKNEVRTDFNLSDEELSYVQYYVGGGIKLDFTNIEATNNLSENNSVERDVTQYNKIFTIVNKTPGILEKIEKNILHISVDDDIILGFQPSGNSSKSEYLLTHINEQKVSDGSSIIVNGENYTVKFGVFGDLQGLLQKTREFDHTGNTPVLKYQFSERLKKIKEEKNIEGKTLD